MNAAVDLGNSRLKILRSDGYIAAWDARALDWESIAAVLAPVRTVVFSSVNPAAESVLEQFLRERWDVLSARERIAAGNLPVTISADGLGTDRVLGILGGLRYRTPPFGVIDLGTAVTVTIVDADFAICGGYIVPGPNAQLHVLRELLPHLNVPPTLEEWTLEIGADTRSAITGGICSLLTAFVGAVAVLLKRFSVDKRAALFLTGGYSHKIAQVLPATLDVDVEVVPTLVLEGALSLVQQ
ncbi:MAG: type III pantothenate kinase [Chlorobiota bacterium]|nr:MAG: type III pantothenate kinase [Chlorobiota bacterium]